MSAPLCFLACFCGMLALLPTQGCEESEKWIKDPSPYLETGTFPGYIRSIPLFGVNGRSGLKPPEKELHCSAYGVSVNSGSECFLRAFNDSVLYHIPLEEQLPYPTERTIVGVEGRVVQDGEPYLAGVRIVSAEEFDAPYEAVLGGYLKVLDRIADAVHHPKSKLDLRSIETFHGAASGDELLIFGRTYDLMYEFDLAFLFEKEHGSFKLRRIFAHHFFKGE